MIQKEVNLVREKRYLFGIILLFFIFTISLFQFLSAGNTGDIGVDFSTGGMQCERTDTTAFWYNASNPAQDKINASNNCSVYKEMNGDFCCPTKDTLKYCDVNISVNEVCGDGRKITRCSDYKTKDECKADAGHVGNVSGTATTCGQSSTFYMSGQACVNVTDCSCYWNNANNSCNALANYSINCRDHIDDTGHCIWYALIEDHCGDARNIKIVKSAATWFNGTDGSDPQGQADCHDVTNNYPCFSTQELPFFTLFNFMITLALIVVIYGVYSLSTRKHKEE